jgi:hypothetical protein
MKQKIKFSQNNLKLNFVDLFHTFLFLCSDQVSYFSSAFIELPEHMTQIAKDFFEK